MRLSGKVAIVTGSGRGIGRSIVLNYAKEGADVVIASLPYDKEAVNDMENTAEQIRSMGRRAIVQHLDVTIQEQISKMVKKTINEFGHIDILVNNAGTIILPDNILDTPVQDFQKMIDTNVLSVFLMCKEVIPEMIKIKSGKIINMASVAGLWGLPNRVSYCSSKHAVVGFTKALAIDMKPNGIAVNAICPGAVDTPLTAYTKPNADKANWLKPSDIADLAVFLGSDESRGMTGSMVEINGWLT